MSKLLLIDGNSIMNRAFYGIMGNKMLMTPDGKYTNAVYGFLSILFKTLNDIAPEYIAVAFDMRAPTKRHLKYADYKGTRKGMPNELADQMPIIKEILTTMNIQIYEQEGYEADDIVGTLSKFGEKQGLKVYILSGDRDNLQLVSEKTTVLLPRTKEGKTETEEFNEAKVVEVYGIKPIQLIETKGLMGDSSDNIPGVPGIGEKTAFDLIKRYHSIDEIYKNIEENTDDISEESLRSNSKLVTEGKGKEQGVIKGKTREKLVEHKELAYLSKDLGTIDVDSPVEKDLAKIEVEEYNNEKLLEIFTELRFNRFIEKLDLGVTQPKVEITIPEIIVMGENIAHSLIDDIKSSSNLYYYLNKDLTGVIYNSVDNKIYIVNNLIGNLKEIFEDKSILKIGYKLKQDSVLLRENNISPENMMFDIEIAAYILNASKDKYTIEELAKDYLDLDIGAYCIRPENTQLDLFSEAKQEDNSKIIGTYVFCIFKLHQILTEKLKEMNQLDLFNNIEMPLLEVLADMEYTGIHVDKEALVAYGNELKKNLEELTKEIYELAGQEFNINSPKQLGETLFEKLNLPVIKKTKTGYSTDVDVLEKLKSEHPVVEKLLEYRQLSKLNSTYVEGMIPYIKENRIHSIFHQTVTTTGRISSTEPNLQNIPIKIELGKKLRKVFTAPDNTVLLDADYSQIELRVLAHIANDENMLEAFKNDEDIHSQAASKVFNIPLEEVTKELRSQAKAVNFGIVYGISEFGLGENLGIGRKKAKEYIDQYLEKYAGIKTFMDNIIETAKRQGYVETLFHRIRYIPEINSNNYMVRQFGNRVALNTPIQGTAADIIKIAMINVYKELKIRKLKSKVILQVHDELLLEVKQEELDEVENILKNCMENAITLNVPLKVDIEQGKNWYDAK